VRGDGTAEESFPALMEKTKPQGKDLLSTVALPF